MSPKVFRSLSEEVSVDVFQKGLKFSLSLIFSNCQLFSSISSDSHKLAALHITWPDFQSNWNSLELPVIEFPTWRIVISQISSRSNVNVE